jgi:hypothetical protein
VRLVVTVIVTGVCFNFWDDDNGQKLTRKTGTGVCQDDGIQSSMDGVNRTPETSLVLGPFEKFVD